jgi:hypothetical protein
MGDLKTFKSSPGALVKWTNYFSVNQWLARVTTRRWPIPDDRDNKRKQEDKQVPGRQEIGELKPGGRYPSTSS